MFPAFIDLKDKRILVVGDGKVATRKVQKLLTFGAKIEVICISTSGKVPPLSALLWEKIEECIPKDVDKLLEEAYRIRSSMKKGKRRQRVLREFLEKRMEVCDTE
jgi:siroheme synthase (precorrin-2 oxidase/ferrochelatase)